jgi:hypothetical protein
MHAGAVLKFEQMHRRRRPIIPAVQAPATQQH